MNKYCILFPFFLVLCKLGTSGKRLPDDYDSYMLKSGITLEKYIVREGILRAVVSYEEGSMMRDSVVIDSPDKYTIYTLDEYGCLSIDTLMSLLSYPKIRFYLPNPFFRINHLGIDLKRDVLSTFYLNIVETILMSADNCFTEINNIGHHKTLCSFTDINTTYRNLPLLIEKYFYNQPISCMTVMFSKGYLHDFTIFFKTGVIRCILKRKGKFLKEVRVVLDNQDGKQLLDKYVYVYDNI